MPVNPKKKKPTLSAELRAIASKVIRKAKANDGLNEWINDDWYRSKPGNPTLSTTLGSGFGTTIRATITPDKQRPGRYCYTLGIEGLEGRLSAGGYATQYAAKVGAYERVVAELDESRD